MTAGTLWAIFGAVLLVALLDAAVEMFLLVFVGVLFAVAIRGGGHLVAKVTPLSIRAAVPVFLVSLAALLALAVTLLAPHIADRFGGIANEFPEHMDRLRSALESSPIGRRILSAIEKAGDAGAGAILGGARGVLTTTTSALAGILVVLFLGIFLGVQPRLYSDGAVMLVPAVHRERAHEVLTALNRKLRGWVLAKLLSMAIIGVASTVGLLVLGVPLAFTLGLLTAILTFVPNVGPVLSVIPPALLALTKDPGLALAVIGLYIGIQFLESYVITPLVLRGTVRLPPALTIFAQAIMGFLFGILGLLTAAPLMVCLIVLVDELYVDHDAVGSS